MKNNHMIFGGVFCKYHLFDKKKPIVFSFSNAGDYIVNKENIENHKPWGYDYIKKKGYNVVSFTCIERPNWYQDESFHKGLDCINELTIDYPTRFGYAGSMGGMIGAFSEKLNISKLLLMNPISSLNKEIVPWETRFNEGKKENWDLLYNDASVSKSSGYIIYDNLFQLDRLHANRFSDKFKHLKLPGVGHFIPVHLHKLGILNDIFDRFINDTLDESWFSKKATLRKKYLPHYNWLLSKNNRKLTKKRALIIKAHRDKLEEKGKIKNIKNNVELLKKVALILEEEDIELSMKILQVAKSSTRMECLSTKK